MSPPAHDTLPWSLRPVGLHLALRFWFPCPRGCHSRGPENKTHPLLQLLLCGSAGFVPGTCPPAGLMRSILRTSTPGSQGHGAWGHPGGTRESSESEAGSSQDPPVGGGGRRRRSCRDAQGPPPRDAQGPPPSDPRPTAHRSWGDNSRLTGLRFVHPGLMGTAHLEPPRVAEGTLLGRGPRAPPSRAQTRPGGDSAAASQEATCLAIYGAVRHLKTPAAPGSRRQQGRKRKLLGAQRRRWTSGGRGIPGLPGAHVPGTSLYSDREVPTRPLGCPHPSQRPLKGVRPEAPHLPGNLQLQAWPYPRLGRLRWHPLPLMSPCRP